MDLSKYRQLYVSETQENLEKMARLLVELESRPDDPDAIDSVFRLAHSIKGMSGTMGYGPLFELAHHLEDLMDGFRRRRSPVTSGAVDVLLAGVDRMTQWVADVEAERLPLTTDSRDAALGARVAALVGAGGGPAASAESAPAPAPAELAAEPGDLVVHVEVDASCAEPATRAHLVHRRLTDVGRIRSCRPPLEALRAGQMEGPFDAVVHSSLSREQVEAYLNLIPDLSRVVVRVQPARPAEPDLMFTGDLGLGPAPVAEADEDREAEPDEAPEAEAGAVIVRAPRAARSVRVRTDWLDTVLNRIGDLLIISQRLWNLNQRQPEPAMSEGLGELAKLLGALHADALAVRMMPLSVLTARLPRVARDLARQAGKRVALVVRGDDEEVDRAIIEGLDAPLTHLLSNAIEHGIEPPEERAARGKRPVGTLTLSCLRLRDELVAELSDDGAGIDRARLARRAVELGLLTRSRAEALAERDLTRLVSLPGLTARDQPGTHAGRGVGMDAVRETVVALGGRIEVLSEPGAGTTVRLRLPRTPGIGKVLLVEADTQVFGLPLGRVVTTEMFEAADVERDQGARYVLHQDQRLRLHPLRHLLGLARREPSGAFPGVVISTDEAPVVVAVDRVVGQQDAVLKPLGPLLERIDGLQGVTVDPLGQPVFVVDVFRLLGTGAA